MVPKGKYQEKARILGLLWYIFVVKVDKCILQAGVGHVAAGALVAHHDNIQEDVTFILRGFGSFCDEKWGS